jgi:hypothetical protein
LKWGKYSGEQLPNQGLVTPQEVSTSTALNNQQVTSLTAKDRNFRTAYLEQWNISVQREFGANSFTVAYVGDAGHALERTVNAMSPSTPSGSTTVPDYLYTTAQVGSYITSISREYNGNSENYNALQLIFNRRASKGLNLGANYVWAHGLGTDTAGKSNSSSDLLPYDLKYDYGNQDLDVRQRVTAHGSYDLPFAANARGVVGQVAKGWKINVIAYRQSGMPFTVIDQATSSTGNCYTNMNACSSDRPNQVASAKLGKRSVNAWFNVDAFQTQAIGTIGNEGVNQVVGPPDRRIDLSLEKEFALFESLKLQFRAESFNLTNTPNFAPPQNNIYSVDSAGLVDMTNSSNTSFGKITGTAWGENPRQFQFALKLLF